MSRGWRFAVSRSPGVDYDKSLIVPIWAGQANFRLNRDTLELEDEKDCHE